MKILETEEYQMHSLPSKSSPVETGRGQGRGVEDTRVTSNYSPWD